jgi:ferredoxin
MNAVRRLSAAACRQNRSHVRPASIQCALPLVSEKNTAIPAELRMCCRYFSFSLRAVRNIFSNMLANGRGAVGWPDALADSPSPVRTASASLNRIHFLSSSTKVGSANWAGEPEAEILLIYGSAALDRAIFAAPLLHLAEVHGPRFLLRFVFETPPPDWVGVQGRLDPETLDGCLSNIDVAGFQRAMLCGPDGMRAAARQALETRRFPAARIFEESFTSPRRAAVPDVMQVATVASADGQQTFQVKGGVTLLEAALDAGVSISFSCFSGGCGACRIQVTDHAENVVFDEPNDVSAEDRSRGNVPACLVRLRGPVTFMVP